jgi:uncharacterized protein (TIGR03790 family)
VKTIIRFPWVCCAAILLFWPAFTLALQPDEIALVVNKNSPDSQKLAAEYCKLRGVPANQVVTLDIPADEEMSFEQYDSSVVGPIRQFLSENKLKDQVKCLLTFYGVPFRIRDKHNSADEERERLQLRQQQFDTVGELQKIVEQMEAQAGRLDPSFAPGKGDSAEALLARSQAALSSIGRSLAAMTDLTAKSNELQALIGSLERLGGDATIDQRFGASQRNDPNKSDAEKERWIQLHDRVVNAQAEITHLEQFRWDAQARDQLRNLSRAHLGLIGLLRVLQAQIAYFNTDQTGSALDSELALLWWSYYPREKWLENPLNWNFRGRPPQTLMVMRLDGPDPATVEKMMQTSVQVENTGLQGIVAIDARGISPIDDKGNLNAFGEMDESLRHLAEVVRTRTTLSAKLDDQEPVFPPHSVKNVAIYCGWYSVQNYIPGCDFVPGAVGFHIASFEMVSLHTPSSRWVRGLLTDGVVATLGPVAEPYLSSFPKPDEFFPLLMTGELTLAEVYWKTTPMVSWMISCIGDPLYTPYKTNPALSVDDLSPGLRRALQ